MSQAAENSEGKGIAPTGGEVFFYHMTLTPLEATLPVLLTRSLQNGWRVLVRGRNPEQLTWLDEKLWLSPEDGFLPHGRAGGTHDADQPVLLTEGQDNPNGANTLISVDGAGVSPEEMTGMERVSILFDGNDPDAVAHARTQWKAVVAAGCIAKYWSQDSGRWELKASS
ncbi:DNA polymerase III subunit chi [Aliiroseovarius crassostreae]|uniref:DNA polymerase III subunit chi n=1 Tax=Aliiroseovarius crassostreae TaxID=154981 RepID=UPI0021AE4277|nr:DNA polymerase III subunit chi [Aliiroseovarius crassostreae]UWP99607.1 DNA polymerase III subunit chi [Aliiroseovarius crassostreae]